MWVIYDGVSQVDELQTNKIIRIRKIDQWFYFDDIPNLKKKTVLILLIKCFLKLRSKSATTLSFLASWAQCKPEEWRIWKTNQKPNPRFSYCLAIKSYLTFIPWNQRDMNQVCFEQTDQMDQYINIFGYHLYRSKIRYICK